MTSIISFLFPGYRREVLGLLLLHPEIRYHVREIARLTNTTAGSLHRELSKLATAQVLIREESGNQVYYRANTDFLIFEELASILRKTSGIADVLAKALSSVSEKIEVAFIFGSVARGTETSGSDIDVLIIGNISFTGTVKALYSAQATVRREINPKVYTRQEWKKLLKSKNAFSKEILHEPKIFFIGSVNDIE